ncbi:MAG: pyridoxamine 5'-phosphate oxidase family protein [Lachnospiraceae bacterium]|jgi:nitroimidazol reductase NimA-like FMN-containing flavoprotein (pyridoxamine 5'-phosphate oxidase superfamily)|nr:pyridoxamine 5'-phosphate oxidase family protein [Lachnospiraceae bacterium]
MRKREREITDTAEIRSILDNCKILHLGLSDDGQPYVVPLNYGYLLEGSTLTFYLHGALEGYKYDVIRKNPRISFAMECDTIPFEGKTACQYGMSYRSLMGKGNAEILTDPAEKQLGLSILMKTQTKKNFEFNEKLVSIINVIKITVENYSAKKRPLPGSPAIGS